MFPCEAAVVIAARLNPKLKNLFSLNTGDTSIPRHTTCRFAKDV